MTIPISDPVSALTTAALNAFAEYCKYLCTPEGQKFAADVRQLTLDRLLNLLPKTPPAAANAQPVI
jgi:hypothetical protein